MKSSTRRGGRRNSIHPLHSLLFPPAGSGPGFKEQMLALLRNPLAAAVEGAVFTSVIISSATGSSALPALTVALPMGVAVGCAVYLLKLFPDFLAKIRPGKGDASKCQRLQLFSICFILGLAFFGQGVLGAQFVEQIFGHVKFFTGFLIIGVGFAGLMLGQVTAAHYFSEREISSAVFDLEIAEPVNAEIEGYSPEEAAG